ncbi:TAXI family TRAP transporter solute-binding subunit [Kiloniella laminariae]|uniref:TAXI family TRAP transporter solute-binding subunit n=1 Tax=Kiloniella laminariae TaxID=454162 RepID=A0ABT4LPK8_9PROT|nr:TAXI family TRAP transporter solute-binding subunit [Kiloniella laminariae]MCZ4283022.1 TAXI family TRAP transporter solute-binding subunit [Kiloniella laminariae]
MSAASSIIRTLLNVPQAFVSILILSLFSSLSMAQDTPIFRIGTGATVGNYFPIGGIIANSISKPIGSRDCDKGGNCGVRGLLSNSVATEGSVANINGIADGLLEGGFAQADVVYWALKGEHIFRTRGAVGNIRSIANLYPEAMHLVISNTSGIRSIEDLHDRKVSLGPVGSGSNAGAQLLLETRGVRIAEENLSYLNDSEAYEAMLKGDIDGFFTIAGIPARLVKALADQSRITLLSLSEVDLDVLQEIYPFFSAGVIEVGTYRNVPNTPALLVPAQFLVREDLDDELVYGITKALWHESTQKKLRDGHELGHMIVIEKALDGLIMPLHPGAERFYREIGMIADDSAVEEATEALEGEVAAEENEAEVLKGEDNVPATDVPAAE